MVRRTLRPESRKTESRPGVESGATPNLLHHRRGWMRIGIAVTVWCSCGWKFKGEAKESEVEQLWCAHLK